MSETSTRQRALAVLQERLAGISRAAGYQTDAGECIFIGEAPRLGESDPDAAIAIVIQPDEPGYQGEKVALALPISVQAIAKAEQPWSTIEAVIADIKKAVETDHDLDGTLLRRGLERGSTQTIERDEGSTSIGASVLYRLRYAESWGAP